MAYEVVVPRLGLTMEEGRVVEWYKQDGETIEAGELLFAVETEKAIQDVEAPVGGVVHQIPNLSSDPLPIGTVIGYIAEPGEEVPPSQRSSTTMQEASTDEAQAPAPAAPSTETVVAEGKRLSSPAARRRAKELGIDWRIVERPEDGPILVKHVEQAAQATAKPLQIKASPVARRLAKEAGIDLAKLAAEKPEGRVQREDVEAAIAAREAAAAAPLPIPPAGQAMPITQIRRVIARRMAESAHTTAPVTLTTEVDATEFVDLRERLKATLGPRDVVVPSYTDLIIKLTGVALKEHPMLNASWEDDRIILQTDIHIGMAVDTEAGLQVPVIRDVPTKSIQKIAEESRSLAGKARARQLGLDDLQGSTFTVTNLGAYGIDAFTPIINLPECAILGVGRIVIKPAVRNDQIVARQMMALSLTFDHRVVDGGPAARFLNTIREYVEQPYLWLTR